MRGSVLYLLSVEFFSPPYGTVLFVCVVGSALQLVDSCSIFTVVIGGLKSPATCLTTSS